MRAPRPVVAALAVLVGLAGGAGTARATATPTVAVMPFKDLSGSRGNVGEAIRETVTSDLKDVPGLKVIERGNIDKVLAEQNLQAARADLDPSSSVKIGKLLGATLIVAGAYQKASSSVRLTARFVKVETGEIVGTAKVDGESADFLVLQDRVTAELLKSAGIEQKSVQRFASRRRPKLKSLKTIELYGDAVVETDDNKKREFLTAALNEDPGFTYASRDLDALEQRLKAYDARKAQESRKALAEAREKLAKTADPKERPMVWSGMMQQLLVNRMFLTLAKEAKDTIARKEPGDIGTTTVLEQAGFYLVQSEYFLKMHDAVLRDGEAFLAQHARSMYATSVEGMVRSTIDLKRKVLEGKDKVPKDLAELNANSRWDLCRVASVYSRNNQWVEAQRLARACVEVGPTLPNVAFVQLISADIALADWNAVRADFAAAEKVCDKETVSNLRSFFFQVPNDG